LASLDDELVGDFCDRQRASRYSFRELDNRAVLHRTRVLVDDSQGAERVSIGGLMALGEFPQEYFPQLNVTFVHYSRPDGGLVEGERFLDNVALDGPIPVMVNDAMYTLRRNMTRSAIVTGAGRSDVWEYPVAALREAVVNALVHRDFSSQARGTQVQIEMYPDRLQIMNAGGLFGRVSLDRLGAEGVSSARNATLMRILEDVPVPEDRRMVCENRGSGIRTMIRALREAAMTPPVFEDRISTFIVRFPNHTLMRDHIVRWIAALRETSLTDSQVVALAMLRDGQILDNTGYRTATGVDSRVATAELQDLVARELVIRVGETRGAKYVLTERASAVDPDAPVTGVRRHAAADRRDEILAALGGATLSRAELSELTNLPNPTVGRWLSILRREGRIELTTGSPQSRHARYRRLPEPKQETLF
jgi:ATP-dependent DNA helicase RecG